ncbi:MAG: DUF1990 family protein, partial [bacterium]|nr:DUF1990 family protein [bacterium]
ACYYFNRIYRADILHPRLSKEAMLNLILEDVNAFVPRELATFEKTKGEEGRLVLGDEYYVHISGPWDGPVRVIDVQPTSFSFITLKGHLEAGEIQFYLVDHPEQEDAIRFEIRSWTRSRDRVTDFFYQFLGISKMLQKNMWTFFCNKVVEKSGGELIGHIEVMTHRTHFSPEQQIPLWKQYTNQFERWSQAQLNFDPNKREEFTEINGWRIDEYKIGLPSEPSGQPVPGGPWETAKNIINNYEFPDPRIVSGIFVPDGPLQERIMIVRGHFLMFTFLFGVKVSQVFDEVRTLDKRGEGRVWGYSYRTLTGHFEMGEITFEIWKFLETGEVEFRIHAYSKPAFIHNPFYRIGFHLFGRGLQKRFGATALSRMQQMVIERVADVPTQEKPIATPDVQPLEQDESAAKKAEVLEEQQTESEV